VAADRAAARGYRSCEAWLLHDVARLGDRASVATRLDGLAGQSEGELVSTYALHARSAAAGHAGDLVMATDRFEAMGACLLAAEASTEASQAYQDAGERRASSALAQRAAALAALCEGASTLGATAPVMVVPLTPRERDIASFAAQGRSSKEIADQLFLSIRTVNNHLQTVYSKLGVSGRRQLAAALAAAGAP
jgi:DNA-binding CsgD family transcriptional regulator